MSDSLQFLLDVPEITPAHIIEELGLSETIETLGKVHQRIWAGHREVEIYENNGWNISTWRGLHGEENMIFISPKSETGKQEISLYKNRRFSGKTLRSFAGPTDALYFIIEYIQMLENQKKVVFTT